MSYKSVVKEVVEFDGAEVQVSFKRLKRTDFLNLQNYFTQDGTDFVVPQNKMGDFLNFATELLVEYVVGFSGLVVDDEYLAYYQNAHHPKNQEEGVSHREYTAFVDIIQEVYFSPLVEQILKMLTDASTPPTEPKQEKK